MSARPTAMPLQVAAAIAKGIKLHAQAHPELWSDQPALVDYGLKASQLDAARPVIVVDIPKLEELEFRSTTNVRTEATVEIYIAVDGTTDPTAAIHEMLADVRRAVMSDEILAGEGNVLSTGWLRPAGAEVSVNLTEGSDGEGIAIARFIADYQWGVTAP